MQEETFLFPKVVSNSKIEDLHLSVRSVNALHRAGIFQLSQLLETTEEQLLAIRNLGAKSVKELLDAKKYYSSNIGYSTDAFEPEPVQEKPHFLSSEGILLEDIPVEDIGLSQRARNCLRREGYEYASQLLCVSLNDLLQIKNMGQLTAKEIIQKIKQLTFQPDVSDSEELPDETTARFSAFCQEAYDCFGIAPQILFSALQKLQQNSGVDLIGESLCYRAYDLPVLHNALRKKILDMLYAARFDVVSREKLDSELPAHLFNTTITDEVLIDLENEGRILETDGGYVCRYPRCADFAAAIEKENERLCLSERLKGRTLEEIGQENGWTRERVRQLMEKALNHHGRPRLHEDRYAYFFDTYYIQKEDFCSAFHEPPETYEYLVLTIKKKADAKDDIETALSDPQISEKWKRRLHKLVYRNYIFLDGQPVKKDRQSLVSYAIKRFAQDKISFDDFTEKYIAWLNELGLGEREELIYNKRSYENKISAMNCVLWNFKNSFRYYDVSAINAAELFKRLSLEQYADLAITTLLVFRSFPDIMEEYDIRDEYELHNLLRKLDIGNAFPNLYINIGKMPTITFGVGNTEAQALDLLLESAPISAEELAGQYELRYGTRKETAMGTVFRCLDKYFYQGSFTIDTEGLQSEEIQKLKEELTADSYLKKDILRFYKRLFPNGDPKRINTYSLKTIGFHVYESYVVSNRYRSAAAYFDHLLLDQPITDMNDVDNKFSAITAYSSELLKLKAERRIVEFAPKQYITMERLNECGITLTDIERYCRDVADLTEEGEYFTLQSLRNEGFADDLDDYGFDDWFYASLLCEDREHFSYRRVANSRLFCRGNKTVQLADFFLSIMLREQQMDIYDFCELLEKQYGLSIDIYKVRTLVNDSGMYYDPIMEKIYIDYETYYEEV